MADLRFTDEDLRVAAARVGLRLPVRVYYRKMRRYYGRYVGIKAGEHHISMRANQVAFTVLYHELTHAKQREQLPWEPEHAMNLRWHREWLSQMRMVGITTKMLRRGDWNNQTYRSTPWESEASEAEDMAQEHLSIVQQEKEAA